jgi:hypothetical protein
MNHLFLGAKSRRTNIIATQFNTQDLFHSCKNLLVWSCRATLKIGDNSGRRVALGRQILLCHLGLHLLPSIGNHLADVLADCGWLDDIITTVDLCETLAFDSRF